VEITPVYVDEADIQKPFLAMFVDREVAAGEEICFSYSGAVVEAVGVPPTGGKGGGRSGKQAKANEVKDNGGAGVFIQCQCGAWNCSGKMWNVSKS
jgi:hypothetical protein